MKHITLKNTRENSYTVDEAYKTIRTSLLFSSIGTKVISFTSCDASDGKSTVSFEVSKSLADVGKKVLYVDADMRKSIFAERFTNETDPIGFSHYLSGQSSFEDTIYDTDKENLHVVFAGKTPPNPAELLLGNAFLEFIKRVREIYDYVIVDTPPLGLVSDAIVTITQSDGVIIIISSDHTKLKDAMQVKNSIEKTGKKIIGCVLNNVKHGTGKYGYYYKYKKY